jgi:DNA-binding MarR family transcriptional regulator
MGGLLRLAWQRVRERIYNGVRAEGYNDLNRAHLAMFRYEGLEGQRPVELAEQMQITKQSVNDMLRHIERHGYVELTPDPADSRARLIRLTVSGRRLDSVVRAHARAVEEEWAQKLGGRRFHEFRETLARIAEPTDPPSKTMSRRPKKKTKRPS